MSDQYHQVFFLFLSFSDIAFSTPVAMTKAVQDFEIDGLLIDNYALTRFSQFLEKGQGLRVERNAVTALKKRAPSR